MVKVLPLEKYRLTDHALFEVERRGITRDEIDRVLSAPEQMEAVRVGRVVYQSRIVVEDTAQIYLLRIVVDIDRALPEVVTAYRTSKFEKYWREEG
jgi:hypothetical protein